MATSTTASLAFTLASQPGRLSAQALTSESSGRNPGNTVQSWTIKPRASGSGDGTRDGADSLECHRKQAAGTLPSGKPCLLVVSGRLKPRSYIPGITRKRDSSPCDSELPGQGRVDPGPGKNLSQRDEDSMNHGHEFHRAVLLDAVGAENGNIDIKVDKDTTPMTCVPTLADDVSGSEGQDIAGKRVILILQTSVKPDTHAPAASTGTLPVKAAMGAGVSETPIAKAGSKIHCGLELDLSPVTLTFKGGSPPQVSCTNGLSTSCLSTFQAVVGAPDYSCSLP